jgi:glycosyltransferase involved in cell wall biosynthesis
MHVLYVHQNFPAQFGHIAAHLAQRPGWKCTFVSERPGGIVNGIEKIQYKLAGGATLRNHFCSRTFENTIWHCDAVYQALAGRPDVQPDLIVGHSGFGSTLFLRELYPRVPIINLFEYYYHPRGPNSDMDFRHDLNWPLEVDKYQRSRCRNAMILLDMQNCDAACIPTEFQKSRFPAEYQPKLQVIFDGVDRQLYHGHNDALRPPVAARGARSLAGVPVGPTTRVITYVSRGLESMRGFDIFLRAARRIVAVWPDVVFIIVGSDRIAYGGDESYIAPYKTFKDWALEREQIDSATLSKLAFVGRIAPAELAKLLASTDLHIYLTVPFVLSWSMMDAMSCGAVVLGSATGPVAEMIHDGHNGLLADFFDADAFAARAVEVLKDPDAFRPLGQAAEAMIAEKYSLERVLPQMVELYERTVAAGTSGDGRQARPTSANPATPFNG